MARESDAGGFKIVITKPGDDRRPKTVEDIDTNDHRPLLEVLIPTWKLGVPRWSAKGTPFIRGSSYAPTEEFPASYHPSTRFAPSLASRRPGSTTAPSVRVSNVSRSAHVPASGLALDHASLAASVAPTVKIEPTMFDKLTFKPACDDRAIVRYSPSTGAVTAATPPRLVAEITSPSFLDYELLSDFFLTYRAYLAPLDLVKMLFARMHWALAREDETGMVVRVRTFVALRHWILNYFVDDFVCEYDMRLTFCTLLNSLAEEMSKCPKARRVQIKILAELKKCWRRVCAQFWDGPEFEANLPPEAPITPGGIPGHRDPSLDPAFWKEYLSDGPPRLDNVYAPLSSNPPDVESSFYRDIAQAGEEKADGDIEFRPMTPEKDTPEELAIQKSQLSPISLSSAEAISCSLPLKFGSKAGYPLAAHPVDPSSIYTPGPVAFTPKALTGKRVRKTHKKSNSTSDSLRDHDIALEQMLQKNTETLLALPYAGSLVRGNVLPPGQAFVEILTPNSLNRPSRQTTFLRVETDDSTRDQIPPAAMSGQGMRKLIGSVRRALSTRGQGMSPTEGNFDISPIGPRGVTANRLPGTPIVPQSRPRINNTRPPVRIDLLGAEVVEDFKRVVREDAAEAAAVVAGVRSFHGSVPSTPSTVRRPASQGEYTSMHNNDLSQAPVIENTKRPISVGELTTGSKSIVIVDDTLRVPNEQHVMTGAIPVFTPSVEAFADSFLSSAGEPSPPNTPPGNTMDTPRRSSYLLGQHVLRTARSADDLPPFVPDLDSLEGDDKSEVGADRSTDHQRRSSGFSRQMSSRPPLTGFSRHTRHRSSRSLRSSLVSRGLRRHASFHSGMGRYSTIRSFDASTLSGGADSTDVPMPQPLRVLRRRPGGDLRAVENVNNLGHAELRRSHSIGSFTSATFSSLRTSMIQSTAMPRESTVLFEGVNSESSRGLRAEPFSVGMMADKTKRKISLLSTMSSRPIMRPSFELEAQKLANIPDDDDDGGVESALLKLEGKFQKRTIRVTPRPSNDPLQAGDFGNRRPSPAPVVDPAVKAEKQKHRHEHIGGEEGVLVYSPLDPPQDSVLVRPSSPTPPTGESERPTARVEVRSVVSDDSFTSIPLLGGGFTDDGRRSRAAWTNRSILQDEQDEGASSGEEDAGNQDRASYAFVTKTDSVQKIQPGETMPQRNRADTRTSQQSFLNMTDTEDDDDDDLSSELSDIMAEEDEEDMMAIPSLRPNASLTKIRTSDIRPRPVEKEVPPPVAMAQTLAVPQMDGKIPQLTATQIYGSKPLPPTPEYTPTNTNMKPSPDPTGVNEALRNAKQVIESEAQSRKCSAHLPFILAFESEILAQQFTLIEKDALNEIDWKELIDMRWKNADNKDARSWVHFLRDTDARGVEVVIARFNIVVKWAISEVVLTQDIEERARCLIKYIHIATHCRRYRNFATMSQIAVALTSNEIARLTKTWKLVPPQDIRTLRELETLISPMRNFYALRAEMEGGGLNSAGMGCIPFVGIYTHDLIFNAQRPGEIASSPTTAPLINFERCRISAGIVKALLRLLEASTQYSFQPIEGITERCLWMSALTDEEIRRHSESLQ